MITGFVIDVTFGPDIFGTDVMAGLATELREGPLEDADEDEETAPVAVLR